MNEPDPDGNQPPRKDDKKAASREKRELRMYMQLAYELFGYLLVLGYLGWMIDERKGWRGEALAGGIILGMVAWMYRVLRLTSKTLK